MSLTKDEIRQAAEDDLWTFAVLTNPSRVYGDIHKEVFHWLQREEFDQLLLLPRAHMKSHCIAVWVAWKITKEPWTTVLYVSATLGLAEQQLYAIKMILESKVYRRYWPEMINPNINDRAKWSQTEVKVDHPLREARSVRDPTLLAKSIEGNTTGLHCDVLVLDDIVVPDNAYTAGGRETVSSAVSQFSSIANPGAITKAVGTRYHPADVYGAFKEMIEEVYDEDGNVIDERPVWEVFERAVIVDGQFLWPRTQCPTTRKWFGFNHQVLAKIRSKYTQLGEVAQYYAQYYNDPNDPESQRLDRSGFQYYNKEHLKESLGTWYYADRPLAVFAAADLAYTTGVRSDYTAIAVIGVDPDWYIYILELSQFKTKKYDDYYKEVIRLHDKWKFPRIRVETQSGANLVAEYIKDTARKEGKILIVDGKPASGDKVERIAQILEPRYENQSIWHPRDGVIHLYEEQIILARPTHDDLKDAVAMAVSIARPAVNRNTTTKRKVVHLNTRFGGFRG